MIRIEALSRSDAKRSRAERNRPKKRRPRKGKREPREPESNAHLGEQVVFINNTSA